MSLVAGGGIMIVVRVWRIYGPHLRSSVQRYGTGRNSCISNDFVLICKAGLIGDNLIGRELTRICNIKNGRTLLEVNAVSL